MIVEALVEQLEGRFRVENRAQVCLWFDDKREFARLLPLLRAHLASQARPPFALLEYDARARHGQVWMKYAIHRALVDRPETERHKLRFVLYLPFSEKRLEEPGDDGAPPFGLLCEYKMTGAEWTLRGKKPTLPGFLREAGVQLPDDPAERRRLSEGGPDSVLARFVARFIDKPALFWESPLTAAAARTRLVDVDQTILDLAVAPTAIWSRLRSERLDGDFLGLVAERYGYSARVVEPGAWVKELVKVLALTDTFIALGQPDDFPFRGALPPAPAHASCTQLLRRWLRDTESRPAWDRAIAEIENDVDLGAYAAKRPGRPFAFPHLVSRRWQGMLADFEAAAEKTSTLAEFFAKRRDAIAQELEYSKASASPVGHWAVLQALQTLVGACSVAEGDARAAETPSQLAAVYVRHAAAVEGRHLTVRRAADKSGLPTVARVADRLYASYANTLNDRFFQRFIDASAQGVCELAGAPPVGPHFEREIWKARGRRAVVIVDALRLDCAQSMAERLRDLEVKVHPVQAALPTVTAVGMTAMLPLGAARISADVKGGALHPRVGGKDFAARAERIDFLRAFGADCREIEEVEGAANPPADLGELLVVFGHEDVDHLGHGNGDGLIRHLEAEIDRLVALVRKVHRFGYPTVHVVTDHGFILVDEAHLPEVASCDKDWCLLRKERYALVPAGADLPLQSVPFAWEPSVRLALPPGLAFFKAERAFSHGGAALQEMVIPHLVSRETAKEKRIGVEVVLPAYTLIQAMVRVTLRASAGDAGQMPLFALGRSLQVDVKRATTGQSVVAVPKVVRLEPGSKEQHVTLFFPTTAQFEANEALVLEIRDVETNEEFPPSGIKLTAAWSM